MEKQSKEMKCPLCGAKELVLRVDAFTNRPVLEDGSLDNSSYFVTEYDDRFLVCLRCGADDETYEELSEILKKIKNK